MYKRIIILSLATMMLVSCIGKQSPEKDNNDIAVNSDMYLLIGTYTNDNVSKGIYLYKFNTSTADSDSISMVEVENPSYLAVSANQQFVYSITEGNDENSAVHAYSFDKQSGQLTHINSQPTQSSGPCYLIIDNKGKNVHTANYGGGSISSFQVNADGGLTPANSVINFQGSGLDTVRQKKSHVHSIMYSPDNRFLFAADLGTDKLCRINVIDTPFEGQPAIQMGSIKEFQMPAGTGPRHFDFHPDGGRYLYVLGELSGEVLMFDYNYGDIILKQTITADSVGARGSADIHMSSDGRFLYTSNRLQADGIAIFSISEDDGTLTKVGYQQTVKHPRNFVISPNGKYILVAGRDDNKIQIFEVDNETGLLTDTHKHILISKPVCLKFAGM